MENITFVQCQNLKCFQGSIVQIPLKWTYALTAHHFEDKKKSKSTSRYILNFTTQECFQKADNHQALAIAKIANHL